MNFKVNNYCLYSLKYDEIEFVYFGKIDYYNPLEDFFRIERLIICADDDSSSPHALFHFYDHNKLCDTKILTTLEKEFDSFEEIKEQFPEYFI